MRKVKFLALKAYESYRFSLFEQPLDLGRSPTAEGFPIARCSSSWTIPAGDGPFPLHLMRMKLLGDKVIVEPFIEVPCGTVFIPETARERPTEGIVMEVGSGKRLPDGSLRPIEVVVGDRVIFERFSGKDIKMGGKSMKLLESNEVLAKVEVV